MAFNMRDRKPEPSMVQELEKEAPPGPQQQLVPAQRPGAAPSFLEDMAKADEGKGVSYSADDNITPLVYVLQSNSPQVNKRDERYVEGAEPGDIWLRNAPVPIIKGDVGVLVQPCYFERDVGEWIPRDPDGGGGGFVGRHKWRNPDSKVMLDHMPPDAKEIPDEKNPALMRYVSPRGTEYVDTRNHTIFAITDDFVLPYSVPMTSTGHSVSRTWMQLQGTKRTPKGVRVPAFGVIYRLKSRLRTRKTQSWFVFDAADAGPNGTTLWAKMEQYLAGRALHDAFASGEKKAATPDTRDDAGEGHDAAPGEKMDDKDIPF